MGALQKLETQLDVWLHKKAPFKLPADMRKSLAAILWLIVLIVGVVQLWGAWMLWHMGHVVQKTNGLYIDELPGSPSRLVHLGPFYWGSFACIVVVAVVMLVSTPKLKQMKKQGWNMLFYATLLNAAFAVFRIFSGVDAVWSGVLSAVVGTLVGAYLLFQVREYFK